MAGVRMPFAGPSRTDVKVGTTNAWPWVGRVHVTRARQFIKDHSLTLVLLIVFLLIWFGQSVAGHRSYNADQRDHHEAATSYRHYLTTGHFREQTFENWESEFLQMGAYVLLTVWLVQRGSPESRPVDGDEESDDPPEAHRSDPDAPWPVRHGGVILKLYKNSLSLAFMVLFLLSFLLHAQGGAVEYSGQQVAHGGTAVTTWGFMKTAEFWDQSLQNWQSEFLAVLAIVILSVYLRQQGSPESKPVHASHSSHG
ncbi:MAG: hypothetical protein JWM05_512 [Acidimicrobiales bacterium]|nr:hypothetical protein [Acidimicrobiales bacterium]